jgi:hypothetical protein
MAGKMTIPIERDTDYAVGDRVEIEIDGEVQPDRVLMFDSVSARTVALSGTPDPLLHETLARFPAGDYSVRLRGVDQAGNAGSWSTAQTIQHRPATEAPSGLVVSGGSLAGVWVDE